ncbi:MAG TPA: lysylphosphatidylglycerol synthase domain-containing protein [Gemmatimonadales bacterium]|nr:lysylphosphatidylglycerol synthase domain-containing protein [Gemmatimonadales bacterium]
MRRWLWGVQIAVAGVVAVLVWRAIARNWDELRSLQVALALRPGWIVLSTLTVFATYAVQIESWRRILAGWGQHLSYSRAARIWLLVNLGRYVPGKVWSVAGLIVLAQRAGVDAWAAAASAFAVQAVGLGTAVAVVAAATPAAESPLRLTAAASIAVTTIAFLAWERGARWLAGLAGRGEGFKPLPLTAVAESAALTLASWMTYGLAFWLLARGLGLPGSMPLPTAAGVFALGYILGLLALFVPGGVGVREIVFIGLLAPALGSGGAVALSVASRVLLTLCEAAAPLGVLLITGRTKEDMGVRT